MNQAHFSALQKVQRNVKMEVAAAVLLITAFAIALPALFQISLPILFWIGLLFVSCIGHSIFYFRFRLEDTAQNLQKLKNFIFINRIGLFVISVLLVGVLVYLRGYISPVVAGMIFLSGSASIFFLLDKFYLYPLYGKHYETLTKGNEG